MKNINIGIYVLYREKIILRKKTTILTCKMLKSTIDEIKI